MFLQIGIGILPAIALLVVVGIKRKACILKYVFSACVLATASASAFACQGAISKYAPEPVDSFIETAQASSPDTLKLAYALAVDGSITEAKQVLSDYCLSGIIGEDFSLCCARVEALGGDYQAASAIYETLSGNYNAELEACRNADKYSSIDMVLGSINTGFSGDEEAVKACEESVKKVIEIVTNTCNKKISENAESELSEVAKLCLKANELYEEYNLTGNVDTETAKKLKKKFENIDENAKKISFVRLANLKTLVLTESYDEIAQNADEYSDQNELMILSELYVNGYIKEKDFSDEFAQKNEKFDTLSEWTKEILREGEFESTRSPEYKAVEKYEEYFDSYNGKPALSKLRDNLESYTTQPGAVDKSKAYMELAKIETSQGNQAQSDKYMTKALETAGICRDEKYTEPVYEIIGIIENKNDTESLKDVSNYVNSIITNTTTVKMPEEMYYQNPQNSEDPDNSQNNDTNVNFDNYISDFVSRKRTSLNIMNIDASKFPQITAEISVDSEISYSASELEKMLALQDCGLNIADFNIEKINYSSANFLLCCDYSGSMDGQPIRDLKEAVKMFLTNSDNSVNYSVVTFTDSVSTSLPFGTKREDLINTIESDYAGGGTNMYGALLRSIEMFGNKDALNVIVLLSDGEDNSPKSYQEIKNNIGKQCADNNITIYTLGLGNGVNSEYLRYFAQCTNGEYLYASGSETLLSFYEFIQNMSANRYKVTFNAENTDLKTKRILEASITDDDYATAEKYYSLNGFEDEEENTDNPTNENPEDESPVNEDICVNGLDTKLIYATDDQVKIKLLGKGFAEKQMAKITFEGVLSYNPTVKFISETEYELTLPGSMACGVYNITALVGGKKFTLNDEFTVALENGFVTQFGKYTFTSDAKSSKDGVITLSGNVRMNNWLSFEGSLVISGDFGSERIHLAPKGKCYIKYDKNTASGLAKIYAMANHTVRFDLTKGLDIYKDGETVDEVILDSFYMSNLLEFSKPEASLYPDRLEIDFTSVSTKLPFQDKIIKDNVSKLTPFYFELDEHKAYYTGKTVGINIEISASQNEAIYKPVQIGSMNFNYNTNDFELKINTYTGEYEIKFLVKLMFLDCEGMGLSIKWDDGLAPDEVKFYADFDLDTTISGVPVTFSDFMVGATDMVIDKDEDGYNENAVFGFSNIRPIIDWKFTGSTKISVAKVDSVIPGLKKYVGDISLASFDNTTLTFSIGRGYVGMSTNFMLLEAIELASASFEAGNDIKYTNELLGLDDDKVNGFVGKASAGIKWEADNVNVDVTASAEISVTNMFIRLKADGNMNIDLQWWVFEKEFDKNGSFCVGAFEEDGNMDFTIRAKWLVKKGKTDGFVVSWKNGELDLDTKYYR